MRRIPLATLAPAPLLLGAISCAPPPEADASPEPFPGPLIGFEFLGSHELAYPTGARVRAGHRILSDGRVVVQSTEDWSLLVFSDAGALVETIAPPEGTDDDHGPLPGRSIAPAGGSEFLVVVSSFRQWLERKVVSYAHFTFGSSRGALEVGFEKLVKQPEREWWWGVSREGGVYLLDEDLHPEGPECCRPDQRPGQWVRVEDLGASASGSLAVLQRVCWEVRDNGVGGGGLHESVRAESHRGVEVRDRSHFSGRLGRPRALRRAKRAAER